MYNVARAEVEGTVVQTHVPTHAVIFCQGPDKLYRKNKAK